MTITELAELRKELLAETNSEFSADKILEQIKIFEKGIPFLKLVKPCTIGDGIKLIPEIEHKRFINHFQSALDRGQVVKFVPASGAATRMFKKQLSVLVKQEKININKIRELAIKGDEDCKATLEFVEEIHRFAFYNELKKKVEKSGKRIEDLLAGENVTEIIRLVAENNGLNYANLPKGSILFHSYPEGSRTAFEEHLMEAMNYSANSYKNVKMHLTISEEHESEIKKLFHSLIEKYNKQGWKIEVEFSFQSPSTDTISVTMDNRPFRDETGKLVFRPGGHGALLKNLNELNAEIVSIKNVDNIVPDHLRDETYNYKKILGGYLIHLQEKVFNLLKKIDSETTNEFLLDEASEFIKAEFDIDFSGKLKERNLNERKKFIFNFLNRPIRVCGMVKKEDHPGGSPHWVKDAGGELTKQIVETAQVNLSDKHQREIFESATHFNPVDLACGLIDFKGNHFNLDEFCNPETGLITQKSKDGIELKALELPGLWNGGMYYWLTVFVEVPKITFNPVKEVNDLLKPEHQPLKL
jgi:hypothetical protein